MRSRGTAQAAYFNAPFVLVLLFGCDANPTYFAPFDRPASSASIVLASMNATPTVLEAFAADADRGPVNLLVPRDARALHLLHYGQRLADLGLQPGRLESGQRCERSCALAGPIHRESLQWSGSGFEAVEASNQAHESVVEFLVPDRAEVCSPRCLRLDSDVFALGTNELIIGALPTFDDRLWLLHADGSSLLVGASGEITRGCDLPVVRAQISVARDGDHRFWVAMDADLSLRALDADQLERTGECIVVHRGNTPPLLYGTTLAASERQGAEIELFAMSEERSLLRYDGSTWVSLGALIEPPSPGFEDDSPAGVIWLGPERALGFHGSQEILLAEAGSSRSIQVPRHGGSGRIVAARHGGNSTAHLSVEGAGLLLADPPYEVWRYETPVPIFSVWSFAHWRNWVATSSKGALTLRTRDGETCTALPFPNVGITPELVPLADGRTFLMPRFTAVRAGGEAQDEQRVLMARILEPCE